MSQTTTLILLPQTTYSGFTPYTVTGNAQPAAAYYLGNRDLQTVAMKLTAATGNIVIQTTLATTPVEADWFDVYTLEANNVANTNATGSFFTNITGNFVHMRAKVVDFANGVVDYVKVSY